MSLSMHLSYMLFKFLVNFTSLDANNEGLVAGCSCYQSSF